jgi:hypothetical protein
MNIKKDTVLNNLDQTIFVEQNSVIKLPTSPDTGLKIRIILTTEEVKIDGNGNKIKLDSKKTEDIIKLSESDKNNYIIIFNKTEKLWYLL